ncbi:hypothetical protein LIER_11264 [Lithospermum erythrorhizon]|uniref:Protein kinase domain-containing protein n=1 Tax=Lithospermum erythrorhizon TaxID=34254 RepID=A0AAV3PMC7_LITER
MKLNRLCFKLPANFVVDDHLSEEKVVHNKGNVQTSKPSDSGACKVQTLSRFLQAPKNVSSIEFHDAEGLQLIEKPGVDHPRIFSYAELFVGSNGFSVDQMLGSGGFGKVYRAVLPSDGTTVAVKCLIERGRSIEKTFAAELVAVANLRHRNLVRLRGWSIHDDQLLLVYDYMPNLSLSRVLFKHKVDNRRVVLSWERRKKIATGLAAALFYLHDQLETQIIHRDVKASNVMLDSDFNARLGDFGLARWVEHDMNYQTTPSMRNRAFRLAVTSRIGGTIGYMPPENFQKRVVSTAKSDVFSFGIVVLEIATGRRAVDLAYPDDEIILLDWIRRLSDEQSHLQAVDRRLPDGSYNISDMERLIHVGLLCTLHDPQSRPTMKWVLDALSDTIFFKLPDLPTFKSHPQYISISSTTTSSKTRSINTVQFSSTYSSSTTIFTSSNFDIVKGHTMFSTAEDENIRGSRKILTNNSQHSHIPRIDTPKEIPLQVILCATNNFSDSHRVAEVDFGTAYHGFLGNSHQVIIKRLGTSTCPSLLQVFSNEIKNLARLRHRNLVQLRGWCSELGEMIVVYDYSPRNILSHFLFHHKDINGILKWHQRYNIIKSLASAIYYLHEGWDEQVIHRCITSSSIVLDPDMNARLGSFALSEFFSRNHHEHHKVDKNRTLRGLFGYMAPEYMESGEATTMADIYSFGIVLLEVVTGHVALDFRYPGGLLVKKVHKFECQKRPYEELADRRLDGDYTKEELIRVIKLGIACTRSNPELRPSIKNILSILDGHDKCSIENMLKKESRKEWRRRNASSLHLVRKIQALGIQ